MPCRLTTQLFPKRHHGGTLFLGLCLVALAWPARADQPDWASKPYSYSVINQDLHAVLDRFAENVGTRVTVSDAVKGTVKGSPPADNAGQFLDHLAHAYGFDWYYDGSVLAITATSEEQSGSVSLRGLRFDDAVHKLQRAGVYDSRFPFRPGPNDGVAMVSGPPSYVTAVARELGAVQPQPVVTEDSQIVVHDGIDNVKIYKGPLALQQ